MTLGQSQEVPQLAGYGAAKTGLQNELWDR